MPVLATQAIARVSSGESWCECPATPRLAESRSFRSAGFYAENLLLYTKQAQAEGTLPIPIDSHHKFSPVRRDCCNSWIWSSLTSKVALGDVARFVAYALTSEGESEGAALGNSQSSGSEVDRRGSGGLRTVSRSARSSRPYTRSNGHLDGVSGLPTDGVARDVQTEV